MPAHISYTGMAERVYREMKELEKDYDWILVNADMQHERAEYLIGPHGIGPSASPYTIQVTLEFRAVPKEKKRKGVKF